MKYGIWRHENALGNSAEQIVNLSDFIQKNGDTNPIIFVETHFQKDFALCIPGVKEENIVFYDNNTLNVEKLPAPENIENLKDIYLPDVYFENHLNYPSVWANLKHIKHYLKFPEETYEDIHKLPKKAIVLSIRESNTYYKRFDGANCEPERFVNPQTFFDLAIHFANLGYKIVRIGDINQTAMPVHENIIDFAKQPNRRMLDDLYLIKNAQIFLSCDSGVWPMAGGLESPLILSNVASVFNCTPPKYDIVNWLNPTNSTVLYKNGGDNTLDELIQNVTKYL